MEAILDILQFILDIWSVYKFIKFSPLMWHVCVYICIYITA